MRIIDADELPSALFQKHVHDGEELEPMIYFEDAVKVVEDAPTIDAIPVEWLEWRIEHAEREGFVEIAKMLQTVRDWWNDQRDIWRDEKEQEAQDG